MTFEKEHSVQIQCMLIHAQRMMSYPYLDGGATASAKLIERERHPGTTHHIFEDLKGPKMKGGKYGLILKWISGEKRIRLANSLMR